MDEFASGLSEQQLKYGYWYATHQLLVQRIMFIIAWIVIGLMLAFSLWNIVDWGLIGGARERALALGLQNDKADFTGGKTRMKPRDLSIVDTLSLPGGDGKVDFAARANNPNLGWYAEMDYAFVYGSAETPVQHGFVLPNSESLLAAYNIPDPGSTQPTFRIKQLYWHRVPVHEVGPYAVWAAQRLAFTVTGAQNTVVDFAGKNITRTSFTLVNNSSFSYWHVPLLVTLEQNGTIVALQEITIDNVEAGESRAVETSWFSTVPSGAQPHVTPRINILDPSVFMLQPGETPSVDIRDQNTEQ